MLINAKNLNVYVIYIFQFHYYYTQSNRIRQILNKQKLENKKYIYRKRKMRKEMRFLEIISVLIIIIKTINIVFSKFRAHELIQVER